MSSVIRLARSGPLGRWFHPGYREPLSSPALNLQSLAQSSQPNEFLPVGSAISPHLNCKAMIFHKPIPLRPELCRSFNTHGARFVERFSPIHF
jgi:hypothetical protein